MAHIPVNHRLRSLYRALGALIGLYVLVFGIAGVVVSAGSGLFERGDITALGLRTNMAFSILSIVSGVVILAGVVIGHNLDQQINYYGGILFLIVPTVMMTLLRTDGNILNFSMSTVVVSYVIGMLLFASGLYIKIGSEEDERHAERYRYTAH
jgi:membrane-associated HD superfamily phosphohydrolase